MAALSLFLGHRLEMSETDPGETSRLLKASAINASTSFDAPTYRNQYQVKQATDSDASIDQDAGMIKPDFDSLTKSYLTQDKLRAAAHSVYRFPHEPTPAQIKAGNYGKRKVAWNGLTISIENEAGSFRRGVDRDGHAWETRMVFPYGYVLDSLGVNGEFHSAHLKPIAEVRKLLVLQDPASKKNKGPLQKRGPLTVFAGLRDAQRQVSPSSGYQHGKTGNGMHTSTISECKGSAIRS